jgi:ParB family transcriptional regulator, chromosome partitioning protein
MENNEEQMGNLQDKLKQKFSHIPSSAARRMFEVPLSNIHPNPDQPRKIFNDEALDELAQSIEKYGQLQPIVLKETDRENIYILAAGERRFRAHQKLGRENIYAVLTTGNLDEIGLIENVQREDLHPMELAEFMARMMEEHSWNQVELSGVIGKARKTVNEMLLLNTLPGQIKEEWRTSAITVPKSILVQIARTEEPERQLSLWEQARDGGLTVRATREKKKAKEVAPKEISTPAEQLLKSGYAFSKRLQSISVNHLTPEDVHMLNALSKDIQSTVSTIDHHKNNNS